MQTSSPTADPRPRRRAIPIVLAVMVFIAAFLPAGLAAQTTVDENNTDWLVGAETGTPVAEYAMGPGTPPLGSGSVHFQLPASPDGGAVGQATGAYNGTRLADFTVLTYSTYQNTSPQAIALQFNVDYDDTDASTVWQGRLVFEPLTAGTVMTGTWQSWNAMSGTWWSTGTPVVGGSPVAAACPQAAPCPWATILSTYPDAAVHSTLGSVLLKAGSGWPAGWDGHADALRIATAASDVTYDFETIVPVELQSFDIK
jgi:hypothetical protein